MGCCQSNTAARATGSEATGTSRRGQTEVAARESPVLTEITAEERALTQLKLIFESSDSNDDRHLSKRELTAALERDPNLGALVKEAGLNDVFYVLNQLDTNEDHHVSWEEFKTHLKKAAMTQVQETGNVVAAELPVEEKLFKQLRELFDNLDADKSGEVSKDELASGLKKGTDENGEMKDDSLGKLMERAGFDLDLDMLEQLDTNKDGLITWDEFDQHLRSSARKEVQDSGAIAAAVVLEEEMASQSCWGCC